MQRWATLHFLDVLAKVADRQLLGTETAPSSGVSSPTTIRNSVVLPDQPNFFARIQLKRSIHEEQLLAILFIDV
jgi:hypothetical protein